MDSSFFALVGLVLFFGIIFYFRVPGMAAKGLDERAAKVTAELEEARKLREEAQTMLADAQNKRQEAEKEAEEIVAAAKREANSLAEDAARKTSEFVKRRKAMAEQKIEQAEADVVKEIRAIAVDRAVEAAKDLIAAKTTSAKANDLIKQSISQVKSQLN